MLQLFVFVVIFSCMIDVIRSKETREMVMRKDKRLKERACWITPDSDGHVDIDTTDTLIYQQNYLDCTSLVSISIPPSVTAISSEAFYGATALQTISFTGANNIESIGEDAFRNAQSLQSFEIILKSFGIYTI